ncbi:hypothetical protein CIG75_13755 [Tumebacillus algifaecis]|uniref:Aminoglycoside phosphotransferase domain-containing protein n=1 Tax=Tumebacillus algifaecis TaxID=1214604 RepID=A0A223D2L2_9BACL|nr:phosphotransferase [Tumebacillus algifaecis]ASS75919.1 hypothetical protein CIG75_13755 [Tumebacillus algifaecis]
MIESVFRTYPHLRTEAVRPVHHGWANQVWIIGERLVFRFPRHAESRRELMQEMQVLPSLAKSLPVPVPQFLYRSEPDAEVMYVGYEQIPGEPLTKAVFSLLSAPEKFEMAETLGRFLTLLHSHLPEVELPIFAKADWATFFDQIEASVFPVLTPHERASTSAMFSAFLQDPANFMYTPRLLHGDLSCDHLLAQSGKLSGVIDFGDLRIGDPAYDFVGFYVEYGADFTQQVLKHYLLPQDDQFWSRVSGFYTQRLPLHSILYGVETGSELHVQAGLHQFRKGLGN